MKLPFYVHALTGLLFVASGCAVQTKNIASFSNSLATTQQLTVPVVTGAHLSCTNAAGYHMLKEMTQAPPEFHSTVREDYEKWLASCDKAKELSKAVRKSTTTVLLFANSLQQLATDQDLDFGDEATDLARDVVALSGQLAGRDLKAFVGEEFANGTKTALDMMAQWATEGYRRGKIRTALEESDEPLQTVLRSLEAVIEKVYIEGLLEQERDNLVQLYRIYEKEAAGDPGLQGRLELELTDKLRALDDRMARAAISVQRLERLQKAHAALVEASGATDEKRLLADVKAVVVDAWTVANAFEEVDPVGMPEGSALSKDERQPVEETGQPSEDAPLADDEEDDRDDSPE